MTKPRPSSVVGRLKQFFEDNPEEELRHVDIVAKFSCSDSAARDAVATLCKMGVMESVHVMRLRTKGIAR